MLREVPRSENVNAMVADLHRVHDCVPTAGNYVCDTDYPAPGSITDM